MSPRRSIPKPPQWRVVFAQPDGIHGVTFVLAQSEHEARLAFSTRHPSFTILETAQERRP